MDLLSGVNFIYIDLFLWAFTYHFFVLVSASNKVTDPLVSPTLIHLPSADDPMQFPGYPYSVFISGVSTASNVFILRTWTNPLLSANQISFLASRHVIATILALLAPTGPFSLLAITSLMSFAFKTSREKSLNKTTTMFSFA